jgi:radical SAM enzyme (TIGR01210 family)
MKAEAVSGQILAGSEKAGKTYAFNEAHDPNQPAQVWFQEACEGLVLFVVFYSQACRWSRCRGCNLPSQMSRAHVPYQALMAQVDYLFADPQVAGRRDEIRKVIVSNNGSVLDEATFSSTALMYLLAKANLNLHRLAVLCLETRPEYVDLAELEFIARALTEGDTPTQLELAIGLETFDDYVRNVLFDKGLSRENFEGFVAKTAPFGYRIKCYLMQKPVPEMTDEDAVTDVHQAIDYLAALAERHRLPFNLHLNPTYVARGTALETAFAQGRYSPPRLRDVARAARHAAGKPVSIFIGLSDEGLTVPGGTVLRPGEAPLLARIEAFNRTQDYAILDGIAAVLDLEAP